jgi:hypothetical protein
MRRLRSVKSFSGLYVAAMMTAALIGVFFFGWAVAGLPFTPFDVFDWLTRVLPGSLIVFGIGTMVAVIRALHLGPISGAAKLAEQAMAIAFLFIAGVVGGAILFSILRAMRRGHGAVLGLALGMAFGLPTMLISVQASESASVGPGVRGVWVLAAFLAWGAFLGWEQERLIRFESASDELDKAMPGGESSVARIDRRRFLVKLGGATAAITVAGAVVGELGRAHRSEEMMMAAREPIQWSATHALPNANAPVKPAPGTRPEFTPLELHYRIDINTIPPKIDASQWRFPGWWRNRWQ